MKITDLIWLTRFVEKIERKHGVSTDEVEQAFTNHPQIRLIERGMLAAKIFTGLSGKQTAGVI